MSDFNKRSVGDVPAPKRKAKKPPVEIVCCGCKHTTLKTNACAWSDPSVGRVWLCQECAGKMLRGFR